MDKRENLRENAYRPMTDPWGTPNTIIAASLFYTSRFRCRFVSYIVFFEIIIKV